MKDSWWVARDNARGMMDEQERTHALMEITKEHSCDNRANLLFISIFLYIIIYIVKFIFSTLNILFDCYIFI